MEIRQILCAVLKRSYEVYKGKCKSCRFPPTVEHGIPALGAVPERTELKILEGYVLTVETCVCSIIPLPRERRLGAIGLGIPGQLMRAVQLDRHGLHVRVCESGEAGVLVASYLSWRSDIAKSWMR